MPHFFPAPMDSLCLPWGLEQCQQWMAVGEDVLHGGDCHHTEHQSSCLKQVFLSSWCHGDIPKWHWAGTQIRTLGSCCGLGLCFWYWAQPCLVLHQQCPCLENSTNVQSHNRALPRVPKQSKTLRWHSKTGTWKGTKKLWAGRQTSALIHQLCLCKTHSAHLQLCAPSLRSHNQTQRWKFNNTRIKKILLFPNINPDIVLVDRILKIAGSLCWEHPQEIFSLQILGFSKRGVFMYSGTAKEKHCTKNAYGWWGWFLVITCSRNRPWTSKGYKVFFCVNINLKNLEQHKCKSLLCH